jgi:hypothetical protein
MIKSEVLETIDMIEIAIDARGCASPSGMKSLEKQTNQVLLFFVEISALCYTQEMIRCRNHRRMFRWRYMGWLIRSVKSWFKA